MLGRNAKVLAVLVLPAALLAAAGFAQPPGGEGRPAGEGRPGGGEMRMGGQPGGIRATMRETLITASGSSTLKKTPDKATISVGAAVTEKTPGAAHDKLNITMEKVVANVKGLQLPGMVIQTSMLSLTPVYDYRAQREGEEPRITGYRASNIVTVEVTDPKKVGPVIDAAMNGGANSVNGISFSLSDDKDAKHEVLAAATKDARAKAEAMAGALGLRITRVVEVNSGPVAIPYQPRFGGAEMMMKSADGGAPAVVEAGEASWTANATVVFAAEPNG
jgi:uncharacterized protein